MSPLKIYHLAPESPLSIRLTEALHAIPGVELQSGPPELNTSVPEIWHIAPNYVIAELDLANSAHQRLLGSISLLVPTSHIFLLLNLHDGFSSFDEVPAHCTVFDSVFDLDRLIAKVGSLAGAVA